MCFSFPLRKGSPIFRDVTERPTSLRLFWSLQIGGWALLLPMTIGVTYSLYQDWRTVVLIAFMRQGFGFLITLGMWRIFRRWPAENFKLHHHAMTIGSVCVGATLLDVLAIDALRQALALPPLPDVLLRGIWFLRGAVYVGWTALYFLIRHQLHTHSTELRFARAEAVNREAELLQLRAQMNPHFLFNALSNIISQAEDNPKAVVETTHAMADYLRYSLSHNSHHAPLGAELDALRNYLEIERVVHGSDRLVWRIDATPESRRAITPTALVQPLIENAIKYGLRTSPRPLQLRVIARIEGGRVLIAVENSGHWVERDAENPRPDSTGIGLANLRRRLELLYGRDAGLVVSTPPGFIRIEVQLPFDT